MDYIAINKLVESKASIINQQSVIPIADIKKEPELNLDSDECSYQNEATIICTPKAEIKNETVPYQVIYPVHETKEEPELQIDGGGVLDDITEYTKESSSAVPENLPECSATQRYQCEVCAKTFKSGNNLSAHLLIHKESENYHCDQCSATFKTYINFYDHMKNVHSAKISKCLFCNETFNLKHDIIQHHNSCHSDLNTNSKLVDHFKNTPLMLQTPQNPAAPQLTRHQHNENYHCTAAYKTHQNSNEHRENINSTKRFPCAYCVATFNTKSHHTRHMDTHSDLKRHRCKHCPEAFNTNRKLFVHFKNTHSMEKFHCHHCSSIEKSKKEIKNHLLQNHMHSKTKLECLYCGKTFSFKSKFITHMDSHSDLKKYQCKHCSEAFNTKFKLLVHFKKTHSMLQKNQEQRFECLQCFKIFNRKSNLIYHMDSHSDLKKYQCKHCSEAFNTNSKLKFHSKKAHSMLHKNLEIKFECFFCSKTYYSKTALFIHMDCHSDLKKYQCECSEAFNTQSKLIVHFKKTHSMLQKNQEKRFECLQCFKTYTRKENLIYHMDTHSDLKKYQCKHCSKAFNTQAKLIKHFEKTHTP